jgi:NAD(P)H dehydrogenase (quinone)
MYCELSLDQEVSVIVMKISIILAHPNTESFNHAIANTAVDVLAKNGYDVCFHDLYAEQFDPLLPYHEFEKDAHLPPEIERYCREITASDGIIIVHPNWWGQPPAILKGWIDRVIRPGVAYQFLEGDSGEGIPIGLLKAKAALIFNTSNTPLERELRVFGDPLETLWKHCIFELCGVPVVHREMFRVIVTSTIEQRREWLEKVRTIVKQYF